MELLERLAAIEEIKSLSARRVRYLDQKRWDLYGSVHTHDACSESYGDTPKHLQPVTDGQRNRVVGPQALTETIRRLMEGPPPITSCHHLHQPEITFSSDVDASGIWPMEDYLWWQNGEVREYLHGHGHYEERYRKESGTWLICYRRLSRLRVEMSNGFQARSG